MKEWLYYIANTWLFIPMRICFRKIHFDGGEHFKKGVPIFMASNHPNSFLDGVIFESSYWRKIYTLARGDAFLKPAVNYIFRGFRLLPIFRATDASADVARSGNARTKDELYEHFKKNDSVLIFSEGIAFPEKAVRRLKKGTAQIAIDLVKKSDFTLDLHILPTALNYSDFGSYMQTVHVQYAAPIKLLDYKERILDDERECVDEITKRIADHLHNNVVTTKGDHTEEKELMQRMLINESYVPLHFTLNERWKGSISKLNYATDDLIAKTKEYGQNLTKAGIVDENVGQRMVDILSIAVALLSAIYSLPVFLILVVCFWLVNVFIDKKIKNIVFHDSFRVGFGMILSVLVALGAFIYFAQSYDGLKWVGVTAISLYGAVCWARLVESVPYLSKNFRWWTLPKEKRNDLKSLRSQILSELDV